MSFAARHSVLVSALAAVFGWDPNNKSGSVLLSDGTRTIDGQGYAKTTRQKSTGKWYFEATLTKKQSNSGGGHFGVANAATTYNSANSAAFGGAYVVVRDDGNIFDYAGNGGGGYAGGAIAQGDVLGVAINFATLALTMYRNGTLIYSSILAFDTYYPFGTVFNNIYAWTIPVAPQYLPNGFTWWGS